MYIHTHTQPSMNEVTAICPIHNNVIWMGTKSGTIVVLDATTLTITFTGKLEESRQMAEQSILDIIHVDFGDMSLLLVTSSGRIWSLYDKVSPNGFEIHDQFSLPDYTLHCHVVKVKNEESLEVWGTLENNSLFFLEKVECSGWKKQELSMYSEGQNFGLSSCIIHAHFTGGCGSEMSHVWISHHHCSVLVSFDVVTRKQRCVINCVQYISKLSQHLYVLHIHACKYTHVCSLMIMCWESNQFEEYIIVLQ